MNKKVRVFLENLNNKILRIYFYKFIYRITNNLKYMDKANKLIELNIRKVCRKTLSNDYNLLEDKKKIPKIIWVFWWQTPKEAPLVVRNCIKSIEKNNPDYKINFINKDNYCDYITINSNTLNKFLKGNISITNFSDILRFNLLYKYGGIWLDATIYQASKIPTDILDCNFYTAKRTSVPSVFVSKFRWASYFMAGSANNRLFKFIVDMYNDYLENQDYLIDYLIIDHIINIGYSSYDSIKALIDNVPINNENINFLQDNRNEIYNANVWKKIKEKTYLHKLSYKVDYIDNKDTYYNKLVK